MNIEFQCKYMNFKFGLYFNTFVSLSEAEFIAYFTLCLPYKFS